MRVLVLGSSGLFGQTLVACLKENKFEVLEQSRSIVGKLNFDPGCYKSLIEILIQEQPEFVINLVASTNVDQCELDLAYAYSGNVRPAATLAAVTMSLNKKPKIIHISTDHLYDGLGFKRENEITLLNEYAKSKFAGEGPILGIGGTILRTNFFGKSRSSSRQSLTDWLYKTLLNNESVTVFDNVYINALNINTLAKLVIEVIKNPVPGIFNLGSLNGFSKAELAFKFAELLGFNNSSLKLGKFISSNIKVKRPLDMRMNVDKFSEAYQIILPDFDNQIQLTVKEYLE